MLLSTAVPPHPRWKTRVGVYSLFFSLWNTVFLCFGAKTGYSWHLSGLCLFLQGMHVFKKEKLGRTLGHSSQIEHSRGSKENSRVTVFLFLEKSFWVLNLSGVLGLPQCFPSHAQTSLSPPSLHYCCFASLGWTPILLEAYLRSSESLLVGWNLKDDGGAAES